MASDASPLQSAPPSTAGILTPRVLAKIGLTVWVDRDEGV